MRTGARVLLVEDSPTTARATAKLLEDGALEAAVAIVVDADAALAHLRAEPVDLIIVDLSLAEGSGLDVLATVRTEAAWRELPVVVLSGTSDPAVVQRSYDLGANCFVRKPRLVVELIPAVRAIEQYWIRHGLSLRAATGDMAVFTLPLEASGEAVREARRTVRRLLEGWDLGDLGSVAELCASELATNAVIHARTPVLMAVALLRDGVRVEVEDESPGALEPGELVHDRAESGRGLALVDALTEAWGVEQHLAGKTVWFELRKPQG